MNRKFLTNAFMEENGMLYNINSIWKSYKLNITKIFPNQQCCSKSIISTWKQNKNLHNNFLKTKIEGHFLI